MIRRYPFRSPVRARTLLVHLVCVMCALLALSACKAKDDAEPEKSKAETTATTTTNQAVEGTAAEGTPSEADEAPVPTDPSTTTATPAPDQDEPSIVDAVAPGLAAAGLGASFEALAAQLPQDTLAVAVLDVDGLLRAMTPGGTDAIRQSLRKDLSELLNRELGIDLSGAQHLSIAGGGSKWVALIIDGSVTFDPALATEEIGGLKARVLKEDDVVAFELDGRTWLVPRVLAATFTETQSQPKLKDAAHYAAIQKALGAAGDEGVLIGALYNDPKAMGELGITLPQEIAGLDTAAISVGRGVSLVVTGKPEAIQGLQALYEGTIGEARDDLKRDYDRRGELGFDRAVGTILAHHVLQSLEQGFSPKFDGEVAQLRLGTEVLLDSGSVAMLAATTGFLFFSSRTAPPTVEPGAVATPEVVTP